MFSANADIAFRASSIVCFRLGGHAFDRTVLGLEAGERALRLLDHLTRRDGDLFGLFGDVGRSHVQLVVVHQLAERALRLCGPFR